MKSINLRYINNKLCLFIYFVFFSDCKNKVSSLTKGTKTPILVNPVTNDFVEVDRAGYIDLPSGVSIILGCPDGNVVNRNVVVNRGVAQHVVTCDRGAIFKDNQNLIFTFDDFSCSKPPKVAFRHRQNFCILNYANYDLVQVGYEIGNSFLQTYEVCYDTRAKNPIYSHAKIKPGVGYGQLANNARKEFLTSSLGIVPQGMKQVYQTALTTINRESGLPDNLRSDTIARGHLTANSDFPFNSQQGSTFYYFNVVPQWQSINNGNWKTLEGYVRNYVNNLGHPLDIYTGTYGILSEIDSVTSLPIPLYLHGKKEVPVPAIIWKIMYDPTTNKGIAFISHNTMYFDLATFNSHICPNIINRVNGLNLASKGGVIYACTVNDLRNSINVIPNIYPTGLLL